VTGVASHPDLESLESRRLNEHIEAVRRHLITEYRDQRGVPEARVREVVDAALHKFEKAHVRQFLPILVERAARARLDREPVTPPTAPTNSPKSTGAVAAK
jgi:hypothetical protein